MNTDPLRLLLIEDSPADAELAVRAIMREGFSTERQRAESEEDMT